VKVAPKKVKSIKAAPKCQSNKSSEFLNNFLRSRKYLKRTLLSHFLLLYFRQQKAMDQLGDDLFRHQAVPPAK